MITGLLGLIDSSGMGGTHGNQPVNNYWRVLPTTGSCIAQNCDSGLVSTVVSTRDACLFY